MPVSGPGSGGLHCPVLPGGEEGTQAPHSCVWPGPAAPHHGAACWEPEPCCPGSHSGPGFLNCSLMLPIWSTGSCLATCCRGLLVFRLAGAWPPTFPWRGNGFGPSQLGLLSWQVQDARRNLRSLHNPDHRTYSQAGSSCHLSFWSCSVLLQPPNKVWGLAIFWIKL